MRTPPLLFATALSCAAITPIFASVVVPPEAIDQYKAHCAEQWTKRGVLNTEMFDYCVRLERDGYAQMVQIVNKYESRPWTQALLDYIIRKWTKRGIRQDEMVGYNLSQETDAYEDMIYETKQPSFNKDKMTACYSEYGIDFDMLRYCYKQDDEVRARATLLQTFKFEDVFPSTTATKVQTQECPPSQRLLDGGCARS